MQENEVTNATEEEPLNDEDLVEGDSAESGETSLEVDASEELAAKAAQISAMRDKLLRTAADFDNYRKRARRDVEEAARRSKEQTLLEILPLVDNLERAIEAADSATDVEAVTSGVRMVLRSFEDIAARLSLERVEAMGAAFDPSLHDAVQHLETEEHPPGTIVTEITPGYRIGERLLRAALVVVARPVSSE